jgi:hypothetical protein
MNQPAHNDKQVSDEEIVADLFRLARTERFKKVAPLLKEAEAMYPSEPPERIKACLKLLGGMLWDTDHGGYATEYKQHRRPKGSGLLNQTQFKETHA